MNILAFWNSQGPDPWVKEWMAAHPFQMGVIWGCTISLGVFLVIAEISVRLQIRKIKKNKLWKD